MSRLHQAGSQPRFTRPDNGVGAPVSVGSAHRPPARAPSTPGCAARSLRASRWGRLPPYTPRAVPPRVRGAAIQEASGRRRAPGGWDRAPSARRAVEYPARTHLACSADNSACAARNAARGGRDPPELAEQSRLALAVVTDRLVRVRKRPQEVGCPCDLLNCGTRRSVAVSRRGRRRLCRRDRQRAVRRLRRPSARRDRCALSAEFWCQQEVLCGPQVTLIQTPRRTSGPKNRLR